MTKPLKAVDNVILFACPQCKRQCRMSEKQRAVQHSEPTCETWRAHKGNAQEFLRLALMAAKGNMILGTVGASEVQQPEDVPERTAVENEKAKNEILEQLYEGLKKL